MQQSAYSFRKRRRGAALISVLFFLMIVSILLMGIGSYAVSHQTRAKVDADYAAAMDLAEAGVNYQFRKISYNPSLADQYPGTTYNYGGGTFRVYCINKDGSSPWVEPNELYVIATGTVNGVSRSVKVSAKGYSAAGRYAIYTMDSVSVWNGSAMLIDGDVGSNGKFDFSGHPGITGSVYFNGPSAGWYQNNDPGGYTVHREPRALTWETVDQKALALFPNSGTTAPGGLAYLATHNDNARAIPPITGNSITNSTTLVGPGDYYVENINLSGSRKITFNNTNGSIRLWVGPSGGTGTCRFRGGTGAIAATSDPTKQNYIYVATRSGIDIAGNERLDAVIYAYNKDNNGNSFGYVINSGNPIINGQILANEADINGNLTINYVKDFIKPTSFGYYGFDNSWEELNAR